MKMYIKQIITFLLLILTFSALTSSQSSFTCVNDGYFAYNSCTQFYVCVYTNTTNAYKVLNNCPSGLLFDNNLQYCNYANQVVCGNSPTQTTLLTTTKQTSKMTTILGSTMQPTTVTSGKLTSSTLTTTGKFEKICFVLSLREIIQFFFKQKSKIIKTFFKKKSFFLFV